jgi:methionine-gamma-lyase
MGARNPKDPQPTAGIGTLVNHIAEGEGSHHSHITPIYQTSAFSFPDVATGVAIWQDEQPGYIYSRLGNPNHDQVARKVAALEGLDLLRARPEAGLDEVVAGMVFGSGMAAITSAILARAHAGDVIIAQESLYGATHIFLNDLAPRYGLRTVFLADPSPENWEAAFAANPGASLAYVETPANPTMSIVDLQAVAAAAHRYGAYLMVDNTFATPYCQRPLSLGADVVIHSTTKYLSGHGLLVGGVVVSPHRDYVRNDLYPVLKVLGGCAGPFDAWLTGVGLRTFELRMQRHCENAMQVARFLEAHPSVDRVHYPGLESHPGHATACRQMEPFGGMISFELKDGFRGGEAMMNRVRLATLAVSLGNVDTLIQHPASMTHSQVSAEARRKMGITDGLVRLSVGIENVEDILADLNQALDT